MSEFYKNLKKLREEKGISLEDINKRTKINAPILKAIENGEFSDLTDTYQRLFIRAYATEIGEDPDRTIYDLEQYLDTENKKDEKPIDLRKEPIEKSEKPIEKEKIELNSNKRSAKDVRSDIIKGSILIAILIFSIYIIRLINEEEENESINDSSEYIQDSPLSKFFEESYTNEELWG